MCVIKLAQTPPGGRAKIKRFNGVGDKIKKTELLGPYRKSRSNYGKN